MPAAAELWARLGVKADGDSKHIVMIKGGPPRRQVAARDSNDAPNEARVVEAVPLEQENVYLRAVCDFRDKADKARFYYSLDGDKLDLHRRRAADELHFAALHGLPLWPVHLASKEAGGHADFDYFHMSDEMASVE